MGRLLDILINEVENSVRLGPSLRLAAANVHALNEKEGSSGILKGGRGRIVGASPTTNAISHELLSQVHHVYIARLANA